MGKAKRNKQNRNKHIDTENKLMVSRWKGEGGMDKTRGKGLRCANCHLKNSHKCLRCSAGNTVSDIVVTMRGARWALDLPGRSPHKV